MRFNGILEKGVPANLPKFILFIRIAIVVLSVVILALAAYALSVFGSYAGYLGGYSGVSGLLIFVVIKTWIIFGVLALFEYRLPQFYYRIVAAVAYALSIVFWLSAWAWSASIAAVWLGTYCYGGFCDSADSYAKREGGALAACAGLGAVVWVLSIVHLVFFVRACISSPPAEQQAELGQVPVQYKEAQGTVYPVATGAAPGQYQQQPVYGQ